MEEMIKTGASETNLEKDKRSADNVGMQIQVLAVALYKMVYCGEERDLQNYRPLIEVGLEKILSLTEDLGASRWGGLSKADLGW